MRICLGQSTEKSVLEILDGAAHPSGREPVTDIQFEARRIIGGVDDCNHRGKHLVFDVKLLLFYLPIDLKTRDHAIQ